VPANVVLAAFRACAARDIGPGVARHARTEVAVAAPSR
jgi:hypothetical protein